MKPLHQGGDILNHQYEIQEPLGAGGVGMTYLATDLHHHQSVAVKVLSLRQITDWKALELFKREAKILASLNHPCIPHYLDSFQLETPEDCRFYLVQELAPGKALSHLIQQGWQPTESEVKQIAFQILDILDYLHQFSPPIIHRDLKPQNLIQRADGKIYLVDFGAVQDVYRNTLTRGGTFVGTLGYMPNEQFTGQVQPASDLYSLGATLLFLLTQRLPGELAHRGLKLDFRRHISLSPSFAQWLDQMLEPVVEERFQTAEEAREALKATTNAEEIRQRKFKKYGDLTPVPPAITSIRFQKTKDELRVFIPSLWQKYYPLSQVLGMIMITVIFLITGINLLEILSLEGLGAAGLFLLQIFFVCVKPFFLIPALLAIPALGGKCNLVMNRHAFAIEWRVGSILYRQIKGKTRDIEKVELQCHGNPKGVITCRCLLWNGIFPHAVGVFLSRRENQWLVTELCYFLANL